MKKIRKHSELNKNKKDNIKIYGIQIKQHLEENL